MKAKLSASVTIYKERNASTDKNILATIVAGETVIVNNVVGNWLYVTYNEYSGWSCHPQAFVFDNDGSEDSKVNYNEAGIKNIDYKATIKSEDIKIYDSPSSSGALLYEGEKKLKKDDKVTFSKKSSLGWYYVDEVGGWIKSGTNEYVLDTGTIAEVEEEDDDISQFSYLETQVDYQDDTTTSKGILEDKNGARGVFGMPYQYMACVDNRYNTRYGRKYTDKIISNMPVLTLIPGKPKFMKKFNKGDKVSVLKSLATSDDKTLNELLNTSTGKIYSLDFAIDKYYAVVNPICKNMARLLNLQNHSIDGISPLDYDWQRYISTTLSNYIGCKNCLAFYVESETQITETLSNSTGQSQLAGAINQLSDLSRELQFMLGAGAGTKLETLKTENYEASKKEIDNFVKKYSSILPGSLGERLSEGAMTVAVGGKLDFPEIYNDSTFSSNYNVVIKLRAPYDTPFGIYMDILVPLAHLIGLAAPMQLGGNGYCSPFIIRGSYKGFFNVDMGIITDMSISRGDRGKWTRDGLPTAIDVSISIKDLYQVLSLTAENKLVDFISNTAELDYIACLTGVNVMDIDFKRNIQLLYYNTKNAIENRLTFNHFMGLKNYLMNLTGNFRSH